MMARVQFDRHTDSPFDPYYVSPWQNEGLALDEPVLQTLRGDFFCMPFGEDNRYEGEAQLVDGENT
ncbi:MAG: hypothetical protein ACOCWU_05795 [Spirochaetota bacterium]